MIKASAENGWDEKKMWASVDVTEKAMDYIKEVNPEKYDCFMRELHETLNGRHYNEEMALADVAKLHYIGTDKAEHTGAHWTLEQIETATANVTFPKGTTKWDKYVAYNAAYSDFCTKFDDAQILDIAYLFYFDDKDWKSSGKIWDYMGLNK